MIGLRGVFFAIFSAKAKQVSELEDGLTLVYTEGGRERACKKFNCVCVRSRSCARACIVHRANEIRNYYCEFVEPRRGSRSNLKILVLVNV